MTRKPLSRACQDCGRRPAIAPDERYCLRCRGLAMARLRESGYLTPRPASTRVIPGNREPDGDDREPNPSQEGAVRVLEDR